MTIQHKEYTAMAPLWQKVRDVVAGEPAVKARTTTYLPRLASQLDAGNEYATESYNNYLARADFYSAAGRTVQGLVGAIMSKDAAVEGVPDADLLDIQDAIGINHESADSLIMEQVAEAVSVGRYGLLLDKGDDPDAKPYLVIYKAEAIVFWATESVAGRETLTRVCISQAIETSDPDDPLGIKTKTENQLLVLRLGAVPMQWENLPGFEGFAGKRGDDLVYWQEVWIEKGDPTGSKSYGKQPATIKVPTKNGGRYWAEIPMDIVNAVSGIKPGVEIPPMLALCNKLLAHYRGSADLELGRHMTAIPQPYLTGYTPADKSERLVMGCGYAWALPDPSSSVGFLEFSGAGLGHIADGQKDKKAEAAVLGARMLEEQSAGVEAMGTVKLRQSGDRSVLKTVALNVSQAMTRGIQRYLSWEHTAYETEESLREVSYELVCDFDASRLDPAELASMTQALQEGTMSWDTFAFNMRRGEMLPPGVTDDEERERIQMGAPGRSRKDEATMLQADVREGRIATETYLESLQKLGYLADVDIAAESDKVYEQKAKSAELQMQTFSQARFGEGIPEPEAQPEGEGEAT
jgi:hypothetical protein